MKILFDECMPQPLRPLLAGLDIRTAQEMGYPWAKQAVETIRVVCLALDDLVTSRLKELKQVSA